MKFLAPAELWPEASSEQRWRGRAGNWKKQLQLTDYNVVELRNWRRHLEPQWKVWRGCEDGADTRTCPSWGLNSRSTRGTAKHCMTLSKWGMVARQGSSKGERRGRADEFRESNSPPFCCTLWTEREQVGAIPEWQVAIKAYERQQPQQKCWNIFSRV